MDDLFTRAAAAAPPSPAPSPSPWSNDVVEWHGRIDGGSVRVAVGRFAQTLARLDDVGEAGISSLYFPGIRLSHYIKILRDDYGVAIETVREPHGGDYPGRHGRYLLRSQLEVVKVVRAGEVNAKRRTSAGKVGGRHDVAA
jgi:hypothetical protein